MSDVVQYIIRLKDEMSGTLNGLERKTSAFNSVMKGVAGGIGAYFAIDKVIAFSQESIKAYNEQAQAIAQVEQGLKTMGDASGRTLEQLKEFADQGMMASLYDDDEILRKVSANMITFGNIAGEQFDKAQQAAIDLSARLGQDLQSSAIMVGKALNDPVRGLTAMRRVGIAFSQSQEDVIKKLVETGKTAEAQKVILEELGREFGGSAKAAYDALSPMEKMNKSVKQMHENVGELLIRIQNKFVPVINYMVSAISNFTNWARRNAEDIKIVIGVVAILTAAYVAYRTALLALQIPLALTTAAEYALAIAEWAALSPIALTVAALAALAAGFYVAYQKSATFRAALAGIGSVVMGVIPVFISLGKIIAGVFNPRLMIEGAKEFKDAIKNISSQGGIAGLYNKGFATSMHESLMADVKKTQEKGKKAKKGLPAAPVLPSMDSSNLSTSTGATVSGSKSTTINISINKLIDGFTIKTTNMQESAVKVQEMVTRALLTAVNDSQIIANQ